MNHHARRRGPAVRVSPGAHLSTDAAYIEANQRLASKRAVLKIYPQTETRVGFVLGANGLRPAETAAPGEILVHAAYGKAGELRGLVAEAAAHGYAGVVRLLYGYSPECQCITGISVLQSTETPGFGDKISTDPDFLANFRALDARLNSDGSAFAASIVTVKHGTKARTGRWTRSRAPPSLPRPWVACSIKSAQALLRARCAISIKSGANRNGKHSGQSATGNPGYLPRRNLAENPIFVMMLGMCPTLAVSNSVINALAMGVATALVLVAARPSRR